MPQPGTDPGDKEAGVPPRLLVDPATLDFSKVEFDLAAVQERIPQRHEMAFLDRVHFLDRERSLAVGSRDIRGDEFWVRGHIPGRPILPGVLSVEALAQLCTFYFKCVYPEDARFFGFGGVDGVKFRGTVAPGDRLVLACRATDVRPRRAVFEAQGIVGDRLVVEAVITGMPV
jgi:3-hydroxyacyl-[acyl-carrier-protein] dehydratase